MSLPLPAAASRQAAWRSARNILAVRLDSLGDVLMSSPALQALKHASPQTRVTLLASRQGAALARHLPGVDEAIAYDAPWTKGSAHGDLSDRRLIAALRRGHYDAAVVFSPCTQSALPAALMCRLAGIPLRLAHSREQPHGLLTDWLQEPDATHDDTRHEVMRQLDLVRSVGLHPSSEQLVFRYAAADVLNMRRKFIAAGGDLRRPYIVLHPGASATGQRYPAAGFGQAADAICRDSGCQAVFSGGHDEVALAGEARAPMQHASVSLAGQLTLGELAALIAGAQVTVCHESGPAHIAAALGSSVVVIGGGLSRHAPWRVRSQVLGHDRLQPQDVAQAALELLEEAPPAVWHAPHIERGALQAVY